MLQANRFRFGPKILGRSKAIWFGLEIVLGKIERFYVNQKLKKIETKCFDLVHLLSERKQNNFLASLHAVAGFTVFTSIPAFDV